MNMLDIHKAARESPLAPYHEFISSYGKKAKFVYGFVEGKDDLSFYTGFIDQIIPQDWSVKLLPVGNKEKATKLYSEIDWDHYSRNRIVFFLDRDLSDFLHEEIPDEMNIYVTDGYSIENDIVNRSTFERIVMEVCGLIDLKTYDREKLLNLFDEQLLIFLRAMIPIMARIIYWKRNGKKPSLDNIRMKHLFRIHEGKLITISNPNDNDSVYSYLYAKCNISDDETYDISSIEMELIQDDKFLKFVRGKYVFWFLTVFSNNVHQDISKIIKSVKSPPKMHVSLSQSSGVVIIAPRTRIPESLKSFLKNTYCAYIKPSLSLN